MVRYFLDRFSCIQFERSYYRHCILWVCFQKSWIVLPCEWLFVRCIFLFTSYGLFADLDVSYRILPLFTMLSISWLSESDHSELTFSTVHMIVSYGSDRSLRLHEWHLHNVRYTKCRISSTPTDMHLSTRALPILTSHLILNLRDMGHTEKTRSISNLNSLPEPVFATNRFLGNIGAPFDVDRHPGDFIIDDEIEHRRNTSSEEQHEMDNLGIRLNFTHVWACNTGTNDGETMGMPYFFTVLVTEGVSFVILTFYAFLISLVLS